MCGFSSECGVIGVKSLAVVVFAVGMIAIAAARHAFDLDRLAALSEGTAFAIGLFASAAGALVAFGWQPAIASRAALAIEGGRPAFVVDPARERVRELPAGVQRVLLIVVFACIATTTFTNEATARIAAVPQDLTKPSRAGYCHPEAPREAPEVVAPEAPPVEQAGCALVKRAYALGYAKSLGSCAPRTPAAIAPVAPEKPREICTRRQLDEPFVHYAWRQVVDTASDASPLDSAGSRVDAFKVRLDYVDDLIADIEHSVTGTPHASHHLWVNLPDPHPSGWTERLTGEVKCSTRFADLPLWPAADMSSSGLVEHVLGQLLFATRFGTTASCSDYTIHWDAPADACSKLAADPQAFLGEAGALVPIRAVLDRRKRQAAMRALAADLGKPATLPEPPAANVVASVACFVVEPGASGGATGREIAIDGETIVLRELHVPAVRTAGAGPIDVYKQLAVLLGGRPYAGPAAIDATRATAPAETGDAMFPMLALEPLAETDPFLGGAAALERTDVVEVFPFAKHLHAFVDAFRRTYLAQRGRL
jgi:hypothetical protein